MLVITREEKQVFLTCLPDTEENEDPAQPVTLASRLYVQNVHSDVLDSPCAFEIPNWEASECLG